MKKYLLTVFLRCVLVIDSIIAVILAIFCLDNVFKNLAKKLFKENYAEINVAFPQQDMSYREPLKK